MQPWNLLLTSTVIATGAVAAASLYGAAQVISPPRCSHRDDPAAWGLPCEDVWFPAADGVKLAAWLARSPSSRATVIIAHGHGANRHTSLAYAAFLYPAFTVLMPDLRGHGDSEGQHTSVGYHERHDLVGATRYLTDLGYGPIGVLGISMGAATALLAAPETPLIRAVVADSSFAVLRHAVREGARLRGYPGPLTRPLAYLACWTAARRLGYPMCAGDPIGVVHRIAPRPILFIHGEADSLIPVENAHALYQAAGEPKELWTVPGVEHARVIEAQTEEYCARVRTFFQTWLRE